MTAPRSCRCSGCTTRKDGKPVILRGPCLRATSASKPKKHSWQRKKFTTNQPSASGWKTSSGRRPDMSEPKHCDMCNDHGCDCQTVPVRCDWCAEQGHRRCTALSPVPEVELDAMAKGAADREEPF